jgi:hypothetical protein
MDYTDLVNLALKQSSLIRHSDNAGNNYVQEDSLINTVFELQTEVQRATPSNYADLMTHIDHKRSANGLGGSFEFLPPVVDFIRRGNYFLIVEVPNYEKVTSCITDDLLKSVTTLNRNRPLEEVAEYSISRLITDRLYPGQIYTGLDQAAKNEIEAHITTFMVSHGWEFEKVGYNAYYHRKVEINKENHRVMDTKFDGQMYAEKSFFSAVAEDAFGKFYYTDLNDFSDEFTKYVMEMADHYGYVHDQERGCFKARPIELPENIVEIGYKILRNEEYYETSKDNRQCIPLTTVQEQLRQFSIPIRIEQIKEQLLGSQGIWRKPLVECGFVVRAKELTESNYPNYKAPSYWFDALLKWRKVGTTHTDLKAEFAMGLPVHVEKFVLEAGSSHLLYISLVGSKNAVTANWAALMQDRQVDLLYQYFTVGTAKNHVRLNTYLPSGLVQMILIHNDLLPRNVNPTSEAAYIIAPENDDSMPSEFLSLLDKITDVPIVPEWAEYLWITGRAIGLINYACTPHKMVGCTLWRITGQKKWREIISTSLAAKEIALCT